jgi:hypothetical protein
MQIVCAHHRIWVTNEKGVVDLGSERMEGPDRFGVDVQDALAALNLVTLRRLVDETMADVSRKT